MPTYEYRCKDCGHTFDAYQAFTDDALTECPECSGPLKKLFGNVGISFKGSGFYKNDSRSSGSGPSSTSSSSSSESGGATKKDDSSGASGSSSDSSSSSSTSSTKKETSASTSGSSSA